MYNGNSEVEEIFSEAWQKVLAGHSIESALSDYPDYAAEIEPMLRLTAAVRSVSPPALPESSLARIREKTQEAAQERTLSSALAPGNVNYRPYVAYDPQPESSRHWFARLWPTSFILRGGLGALALLAILIGTLAVASLLSSQAGSHQSLETYSGTITKITATAWWIGEEEILVDSATKIYGQPMLGAEMVCVGRPLADGRMKAMEVWIRLGPGTPTILPPQS